MSEPHFLYEKRGHTAICTFNRPERRNSFSMEMLVRMADAWTEADGDPDAIADAELARIDTEYDQDRIKTLIANDGWA